MFNLIKLLKYHKAKQNKMIPHLAPNDTKMFYKYLNKCTNYFEFGSGGSTYQASIRNNIKKIYSVESDIEWQNKLKQKIKNNKIQYIFNEMIQNPKIGEILVKMQLINKINYANKLKIFPNQNKNN